MNADGKKGQEQFLPRRSRLLLHVQLTRINHDEGSRLVAVDPFRLVVPDVRQFLGLHVDREEPIMPAGSDRSRCEVVDKISFRHC